MANTALKTSEVAEVVTINTNDRIVILSDPDGVPLTATIAYGNFFANVSVNAHLTFATANTLVAANVIIGYKHTPVISTEPASQGQIFFDDNYVYVAVANGSIKRVALQAF